MTTIPPDTTNSQSPNKYLADATAKIEVLRALAADFPDDPDPRPLTPNEIRLVRSTTPQALERAAQFADAETGISNRVVDPEVCRDAIVFELAYSGYESEALALARRIQHAILRRKLKAVRAARGLYRVAKSFITTDAGDAVRPHVEELKRALIRPRRKKASAETPETAAAKKEK